MLDSERRKYLEFWSEDALAAKNRPQRVFHDYELNRSLRYKFNNNLYRKISVQALSGRQSTYSMRNYDQFEDLFYGPTIIRPEHPFDFSRRRTLDTQYDREYNLRRGVTPRTRRTDSYGSPIVYDMGTPSEIVPALDKSRRFYAHDNEITATYKYNDYATKHGGPLRRTTNAGADNILSQSQSMLDYESNKDLAKWKKFQGLERSGAFWGMSPVSLNSDTLDRLGYGIGDNGRFFEKGKTPDGLDIPSNRVYADKKRVYQDIANYESGIRSNGSSLVQRSTPGKYTANKKNWVIGRSKNTVHYLSEDAMPEWINKFLGQTHFMQTSTGEAIPMGSTRIYERITRDTLNNHRMFRTELRGLKTDDAVRKMREMFFRGSMLENKTGSYSKILLRLRKELQGIYGKGDAGRIADMVTLEENGMKKLNMKYLDRKKARSLIGNFWNIMTNGESSEKLNIEGYGATRTFLDNSQEGDLLRIEGGKWATVKRIEDATQASILNNKGKSMSLSDYIESMRIASDKKMFPVSIEQRGGVAEIMSPGGELLGSIRGLNTETDSIVTQDLMAKVTRRKGKFKIQLLRDIEGTLMTSGLGVKMSTDDAVQESLRQIFHGETSPQKVKKASKLITGKKLSEDVLEKSRESVVLSSGRHIPTINIGDTPKVSRPDFSKRLGIGIGIIAGAMLLWGATRSRRNAPMNEKDVANNLYGSSDPSFTAGSQVRTPATRIVPQNTGYSTNMDIDSESDNINSRAMAEMVSSIASSSINSGRVNTSIHITDDTQRMDRESVRRQMNSMLG